MKTDEHLLQPKQPPLCCAFSTLCSPHNPTSHRSWCHTPLTSTPIHAVHHVGFVPTTVYKWDFCRAPPTELSFFCLYNHREAPPSDPNIMIEHININPLHPLLHSRTPFIINAAELKAKKGEKKCLFCTLYHFNVVYLWTQYHWSKLRQNRQRDFLFWIYTSLIFIYFSDFRRLCSRLIKSFFSVIDSDKSK